MKNSKDIIKITEPILPCLDDLNKYLKTIWDSKQLTNHGIFHNQLEEVIKEYLSVANVSIFNNGTIALLTALKALSLPKDSEVITTPFTFPATPHVISSNGLKPIFCDIDCKTMCIDVNKIEDLITEKTSAILGVHVYGYPCDVEKINKIAKKHNLKVIYDSAHAFGTKIDGIPIGSFGDISMFSFHATKLFNTIEGGCLTYNDNTLKEKIYLLRNFGIKNEEEVVEVGINGKMNEIQAAIGLLNIKEVPLEASKRKNIFNLYTKLLGNVAGISLMSLPDNCTNSSQYFVIRIYEDFGASRDQIYEELLKNGVVSRKYFYPLCSDYPHYKGDPRCGNTVIPIATRVVNEVLCLPFHGNMTVENVTKISNIIISSRNS